MACNALTACRYALNDTTFATNDEDLGAMWIITPASASESKLFHVTAGSTANAFNWTVGSPNIPQPGVSIWTATNMYAITDTVATSSGGTSTVWIGKVCRCCFVERRIAVMSGATPWQYCQDSLSKARIVPTYRRIQRPGPSLLHA